MKAIIDKFNQMSVGGKRASLAFGAYGLTMGIAIFITACVIVSLLGTTNCSSFSNALAALLITFAVLFLTSIVVVGVVTWRIFPERGSRWAVFLVHGILLLGSFMFMAFVLLVLFNC
jgi:hypothetical protein